MNDDGSVRTNERIAWSENKNAKTFEYKQAQMHPDDCCIDDDDPLLQWTDGPTGRTAEREGANFM